MIDLNEEEEAEEAGGRSVYPRRRRERAAVEIDTAAPAISYFYLSLSLLQVATTNRILFFSCSFFK